MTRQSKGKGSAFATGVPSEKNHRKEDLFSCSFGQHQDKL